jgi:ElaB/YqjD/DUF883 family membrane-anchored ribosome-binding protein
MKNHPDTAPHSPDDVLEELQLLVEEAERMAIDTTPDAGNGVATLRDRFEDLRERFGGVYADARERLVTGAQGTTDLVRAKPYRSLALALGIGVVLGLAFGRRK